MNSEAMKRLIQNVFGTLDLAAVAGERTEASGIQAIALLVIAQQLIELNERLSESTTHQGYFCVETRNP